MKAKVYEYYMNIKFIVINILIDSTTSFKYYNLLNRYYEDQGAQSKHSCRCRR